MGLVPGLLDWTVMCAFMMLPTAARPALRLADGSPLRWLYFMAGYAAVWLASGLVAVPLTETIPWNAFTLFVGWAAVGSYLMLPFTQRHLRACRYLRRQSAPARSGLRYGTSCLVACLPMMIVAMATMHRSSLHPAIVVGAMAALTLFIMWTKHPSVPRTRLRTAGIAIVGSAALAWSLGLSGTMSHGTQHAVPTSLRMGE